MLVQLCDMHWDNLHPRKDRTRSASVAWLTGRIESALVDSPTLGGTTQAKSSSPMGAVASAIYLGASI